MADRRWSEADRDLVAGAIATRTRYSQHGQRCPVWIRRPKDVQIGDDRAPDQAELGRCNCWIMPAARLDATAVLDALTAAGWHPAGQCIQVDLAAALQAAENGTTREQVIAALEQEWRRRGWAFADEVRAQVVEDAVEVVIQQPMTGVSWHMREHLIQAIRALAHTTTTMRRGPSPGTQSDEQAERPPLPRLDGPDVCQTTDAHGRPVCIRAIGTWPCSACPDAPATTESPT